MSGQLNLGLKLKADGQAKVASVSSEWIEKALRWIESRSDGIVIDADKIRLTLGDPPRINAMGSLFSIASKRRLIAFHSYEASDRPSRHANRNIIWRRSAPPSESPR